VLITVSNQSPNLSLNDVPSHVKLTKREQTAFLKLKASMTNHAMAIEEIHANFKLDKTSNRGVLWFCLLHPHQTNPIYSNPNISFEMLNILLKREYENNSMITGLMRRDLFWNPRSYVDFEFFKTVYDKVNADEALNFSSSAFNVTLANTEVLLFVHSLPDNQMLNRIRFLVDDLVEIRKPEIRKWIEKRHPELKGLPLSWILRAYNSSVS